MYYLGHFILVFISLFLLHTTFLSTIISTSNQTTLVQRKTSKIQLNYFCILILLRRQSIMTKKTKTNSCFLLRVSYSLVDWNWKSFLFRFCLLRKVWVICIILFFIFRHPHSSFEISVLCRKLRLGLYVFSWEMDLFNYEVLEFLDNLNNCICIPR